MPSHTPAQQVILVTAASYHSTRATLQAFEQGAGHLAPMLPPMRAVIGSGGLAPQGAKSEGDGRTPSGSFRLPYAFGYAQQIATNMPYRQATAHDVWVDDPNSPQYNQWVHGQPDATSFERMHRADGLYEYGVVIDYNPERIPWLGSAIFLHVWAGVDKPTRGCVAVSRDHMIRLLDWLNPAQRPVIVIGLEGD